MRETHRVAGRNRREHDWCVLTDQRAQGEGDWTWRYKHLAFEQTRRSHAAVRAHLAEPVNLPRERSET